MKLKFIKQIHSNFSSVSSNDIYMEKVIDLFFLPFVGLIIIDKEGNEDTIENLYYDIAKDEFRSYSEDKELYDKALQNTGIFYANKERLEQIVKEWSECGWKKRE